MGLDLQPDLCSLLIDDVIYHEAAVRQAGAEALSQAVARYQRQAAEVMGRLMEIYQEKLYVSSLCVLGGLGGRRVGGLCLASDLLQTGVLELTVAQGGCDWSQPHTRVAGLPGLLGRALQLICQLSVAAAAPSAGCFGTSYLRISSRSVGSQV